MLLTNSRRDQLSIVRQWTAFPPSDSLTGTHKAMDAHLDLAFRSNRNIAVGAPLAFKIACFHYPHTTANRFRDASRKWPARSVLLQPS